MNITITGPRDVDDIDIRDFGILFRGLLLPFDGPDTKWLVGGARGVDTIALRWLFYECRGPVVVVVPSLLNEQPQESIQAVRDFQLYSPERINVVELKHENFPMPAAFHDRNHYMVDASNLVAGFPHRTRPSNGTRATLKYAKEMNVARLEYEIQ